MQAAGRRLTGLLLLAFFLHSVALNGVVLTKWLPSSCNSKIPSIVTIDVCGHGVPSAANHLDLKAGFPAQPFIYFKPVNVFPRIPDDAVASAPPGDIEKPPEA